MGAARDRPKVIVDQAGAGLHALVTFPVRFGRFGNLIRVRLFVATKSLRNAQIFTARHAEPATAAQIFTRHGARLDGAPLGLPPTESVQA